MEKEELTLLICGAGALNFLLLLDEMVASRGMMRRVALGGMSEGEKARQWDV